MYKLVKETEAGRKTEAGRRFRVEADRKATDRHRQIDP